MAAMTQAEVDALVAKIWLHRQALRKSMDDGNQDALDVYRYYDMVAKCPEHMAMILCEGALERWMKAQVP